MFLSKDIVLQAYKKGLFPMSDSHEDPYIFWVNPEQRGIIHLNNFKISKSLKKFIKKLSFSIKINENFSDVIKLCAKNKYRNSTWINKQIIDSYTKLSITGKAISIEYFEEGRMLGGLYGVILGEIFCGESMFSLKKNASKICIAYLAAHLIDSGFKIIDTQFYSDHLSQFGTIKISQEKYLNILNENNLKKDLTINKNLKKNILEYF
ncbi:MAG: leucyl/phenylalanyl-tRNA--protein transferase [Alphaproteobacteria bacterium]|tara:strand:+ start:3173 stop:3796 length:624 start_codon:yes stop_codon:yes gene_type:complete